MNSAADIAVQDAVIESEDFDPNLEQPFAPSPAITRHMIGGDEPARLLDCASSSGCRIERFVCESESCPARTRLLKERTTPHTRR